MMNHSGDGGGETGRGHYISVLQRQARLLGDYEQVHFRRRDNGNNSVDGPASSAQPTPQQGSPQINRAHHSPKPLQAMSITPRRPPRPLYVNFTKNSAALFLRQTQSLWLQADLSRQEASNILLDRPIGSFLVRNSRHARYALSLRAPETAEDPAIRHFLIQHNNQNYLTIQGSNLPFLSIYDLLAYFCYHQSGGMPCCLRPPEPEVQNSIVGGSDSSESDSDGDEPARHPPRLPPRTPSMMGLANVGEIGGKSQYSGDTIMAHHQDQAPQERARKKVPPPKPPRPILLSNDSWDEEEFEKNMREPERSTIRVEVNGEVSALEPRSRSSHVNETRPSPSSDPEIQENMAVQLRPRPETSDVPSGQNRLHPSSPSKPISTSPKLLEKRAARVTSLIDMFEGKSPSTSPTKSSTLLATRRDLSRKGRTERSNSFGISSSRKGVSSTVRLSGKAIASYQDHSLSNSPPEPPPKPWSVTPPLPPRPVSTECGDSGVPIVPPRTPAPLLPPKPPGSKPPTVSPRMTHRRSLSDSDPFTISPVHAPPILPPKLWRQMVSSGYEVMPAYGNGNASQQDDSNSNSNSNSMDREADSGHGTSASGSSNRESLAFSEVPKVEESGGVVSPAGADEGGGEFSGVMLAEVESCTNEWQIVNPGGVGGGGVSNAGSEQSTEPGKGGKRKKTSNPLGWAKKLQFRGKKKPRKRIKKFIMDLSVDQGQLFGQKVSSFITDMRARSTEPHQKMMMEVRNFVTSMQDHLLQHHRSDLENLGMESCDNFGHVVECTLQESIVQPLSHFIYLRIEEYYATNGCMFQLQRSIHQGKLKTPDELGIRSHLSLPSDKIISEITTNFDEMMKTSCAISKLEYLLEAARLTYDNVRDSRQPKKPMTDMGADDFLPIFVWVLIQCGFTRAEIEAEYMWGLAHPNLFNGEGGYYLTTLTSAVNVLKELVVVPQQTPPPSQLPTMNNLQTELKVFFEDEHTGQFSSAYYLPIVPTMTAAEICDIIVDRRKIANPEAYALFTVVDGRATIVEDDAMPQEIKLQWTLQKTLGASKMHQPSSQFFAYKLRTPELV